MKLNKKGFTLVELLAVIVVLALLMVVAGGSIGKSLENSKKASLKTYGERVAKAAKEDCLAKVLAGTNGGATECSYTETNKKDLIEEWGKYVIETEIKVSVSGTTPSITQGKIQQSNETGLGKFNLNSMTLE